MIPPCGRTFDGDTCTEVGKHLCGPRMAHVEAFFVERLVHTKGRYARQPFVPADWQLRDILQPLFGTVDFNENYECYVRQYTQAWIELARKNGKSELMAGIALFMLCADGEEGAEIYGAAKGRDQASIVFDVAARMVELSPMLSRRIDVRRSPKRLVFRDLGAFYAPLSRDAGTNLGQNPHCILFDEVITQPDRSLWDAMRTGMGARTQPLMIAATTAGNDPSSFAAEEHADAERIMLDPERVPHRLVYLRNLPVDADPWDEDGWAGPNPALGDFLSITTLRNEAQEAKVDPAKENAFRQFRLNQWVSQATRWMPMHLYDACAGDIWPNPDWGTLPGAGREVWVGLDLSAKHDLTTACYLFPPNDQQGVAEAFWRFWLPEETLRDLDAVTSDAASAWVRQGWLTLHESSVIDHRLVCDEIAEDLKSYAIREITYDKWSGEYVRIELEDRLSKVPMVANEPTFGGMTIPMTELMNLTTQNRWVHHGNPIARWCFDAVEVARSTANPDLIKPVKPVRNTGGRRVDAVISTALAVGAWSVRGAVRPVKRYGYGFK